MRCIYCGEREANAREHYIPQCFGRFENFEPLEGRLCQRCNGELGRLVDRTLGRKSPEAIARRVLGITGQRGHKPARLFQPEKPGGEHIHLLAVDPETGLKVLRQLGDRPGTASDVTQIVVQAPDKPECAIAIPLSIETGRDLVEFLRGKGVTFPLDAYVIAESGDEERIRRLFSELGWPCPMKSRKGGLIPGPKHFNVPMADEYWRALTKVAFHYALRYVRTIIGDEPEFAPVRSFIHDGVGDLSQFVRDPGYRLTHDQYGHLIQVVAPFGGPIVVNMQLFVGPAEWFTRVWRIELGRNPTRLHVEGQQTHWFGYKQSAKGNVAEDSVRELPGWPTA